MHRLIAWERVGYAHALQALRDNGEAIWVVWSSVDAAEESVGGGRERGRRAECFSRAQIARYGSEENEVLDGACRH